MDVVELAKTLIAIPSETRISNRAVSDCIAETLRSTGFELEEVVFFDQNVEKVSLVAKKGEGPGGLGFFSHSDTVPGGEGWDPFRPVVKEGRLIGRGSCDTKGLIAASIAATADLNPDTLGQPVYIVVASDEEIGLLGARRVVEKSNLFKDSPPTRGIICEATSLIPVYAHKGVQKIRVTAHGISAHSSTGKGESSNFKIAPFLSEMTALAERFLAEERFLNHEFDPPSNGFNMVLNDGGTAHNVTAARTECNITFRVMPDAAAEEVIESVIKRARVYDLQVETLLRLDPFFGIQDGDLAAAACQASGAERAVTVPYGSEAFIYQHHVADTIVLGPGNIAQAHTLGEWIDVEQLRRSVEVYGNLVAEFCTETAEA